MSPSSLSQVSTFDLSGFRRSPSANCWNYWPSAFGLANDTLGGVPCRPDGGQGAHHGRSDPAS